MPTNLKTVNIDADKGIFEVNGIDISKTCHEFYLYFEDGEWFMAIEERGSESHAYAHDVTSNQKKLEKMLLQAIAESLRFDNTTGVAAVARELIELWKLPDVPGVE